MSEWKLKNMRLAASLLAVLAVVMAGFVLFDSDDSNADYVFAEGDIIDENDNTIGKWSIGGDVLSLTYTGTVEVPNDFRGLPSPASIAQVVATNFNQDQHVAIEGILELHEIDSTPIYTLPGTIVGSSGAVLGNWILSSDKLNLSSLAVTDENIISLAGFNVNPLSKSLMSSVSVTGFTNDIRTATNVLGVITDDSTIIEYTGTMPTDGSTYGAGGWTYICNTQTFTVDANASGASLINYASSASITEWSDYFFVDEAKNAKIIDYKKGGAYLFNDFTKLETLQANDFDTSDNNLINMVNSATAPTLELKKISTLQAGAFANSTFLKNVTLGTLATSGNIYQRAFDGCSLLESVTIGQSGSGNNYAVYQYAFRDCIRLTSVNFECNNLTMYGDGNTWESTYVFSGCNSLKFVKLGNNDCSIGKYAFYGCKVLQSIEFGAGNKTLYDNSFAKCISLTSLDLSSGEKVSLSSESFKDDTSLSNIKFGSGNYTIYPSAFGNCTSLTSLLITGTTADIRTRAFDGASELVSVKLTATTTTLGDYAFSGCSKLSTLDTNGVSTLTLNNFCFSGDEMLLSVHLDASALTVNTEVFSKCTKLKSVYLAGSSIYLKSKSFYNCSSLEEVFFGHGEITIESEAFSGCEKLVKMNVDEIDTIGNSAFEKTALGEYYYDYSAGTFKPLAAGEYLVFSDLTSVGTKNATGNYGGAFNSCAKLRLVEMPNLQYLGANTFNGCQNLEKVKFGPSLDDILSYRAFYNCKGLTDVEGLEYTSITQIGSECFSGDNSLVNVSLPDSVTIINDNAFSSCSSIDHITLGKAVKSLGNYAFNGCSNLKHIGNYVFVEKYGDFYWVMPDTLETIGNSCFLGSTTLDYIMFSENSVLKTIGSSAFSGTNVAGKDPVPGVPGKYGILFPATLIEISGSAFLYGNVPAAGRLNGAIFVEGNSLYKIGNNAFKGTNLFGTLVFSNKLSDIGDSAFYGCVNLSGITLPEDNIVKTIENNAFYGCGFSGSLKFNNKLTQIGTSAFQNCSNLTSIMLDNCGFTTLASNAFRGCSNLISVKIIGSITKIGDSAFRDCKISELVLPSTLITIDKEAFYNCDGLVILNLPDNLDTIGYGAFAYCDKIERVVMPNSVQTIRYEAFRACTGLVYVDLNLVSKLETYHDYDEKNASVNGYQFSGCSSLIKVNLGKNLTYLPGNAFSKCSILNEIIWSPVSVIESSCFSECNGLAVLILPETLTTLKSSAFSNCKGLTTVDTNKVVEIGNNAFYDCNQITTLTVGNSVTSLGNHCFYNLNKMSTLTVPITLNLAMSTNDTDYCFKSCSKITTLIFTGEGDGFDYGANKTDKRDGKTIYYQYTPMYISKAAITTVVFGEKITSLGDHNLQGNTAIATITIPIGLRPIDSAASNNFDSANSITQINFIGVLSNDYSLDSASDNYYGRTPWNLTNRVIKVTFSDTVQVIPAYLFYNNQYLNSVIFNSSNNVRYIGEYAFFGCTSMKDPMVFNNVETIGEKAFYYTKISTFSFGQRLNNVGSQALFDMELECITVDAANTYFSSNNEGVLYATVGPTLTTLVVYPAKKVGDIYEIPSTVRAVSPFAAYNAKFTTLVIPALVGSVGEYAFANSNIQVLTVLNAGKDTYSNNAFGNCVSLNAITIPISMGTANVFSGSDNIKTFKFIGSNASGLPQNYYRDNSGMLPWSNASGYSVSFGTSITAIDAYMFKCASPSEAMISIQLPSTVNILGDEALYNCGGLKNLVIPDSVTTIGNNCLFGCKSLQALTVPVSLNMAIDPNNTIGITYEYFALTFSVGTGTGVNYLGNDYEKTPWAHLIINSVAFSEGVNSIGDNQYLITKSISLPSTLQKIGANAFNGAPILEVDLKNVLYLGDAAFKGCNNLKVLEIPASLKDYGGKPFSGCTGLTEVTLPICLNYSKGMFDGCPIIEKYTFIAGNESSEGYNYSQAESVKLPWIVNLGNTANLEVEFSSGVKVIGSFMFYNCSKVVSSTVSYGMTSLSFPSSITKIETNAFCGCATVTSLTFVNQSIGTIGAYAFAGCTGISSLVLGPSTELGAGSFAECSGLKDLTISVRTNAVANYLLPAFKGVTSIENFNFIGNGKGFDYSDEDGSDNYYRLTPWFTTSKDYTPVFGTGITYLGNNMFRGCTHLSGDIELPSNITELGNSTFSECAAITGFSANGVRSTGTRLFENCGIIVSVDMPNLIIVKDYAFYNCSSLSTATLNACTTIGAHAFQNSKIANFNSVTSVDLSDVIDIGEEAFSGCTSIAGDVTVGESLQTIGSSAFLGDSNIARLVGTLTSVTVIGESAFEGCSKLSNGLVLTGVTDVGARAFYGTKVASFTFDDSLANLGDLSLFDQSLTLIVTGSNSKYVVGDDGALYQVNGTVRYLVQYPAARISDAGFTIPGNVTQIMHFAFYGAQITGTLNIPTTIAVGESAFGHAGFTGLTVPNTMELADLFEGTTGISTYRFTMANNVSGLPEDYYATNAGKLPWNYNAVEYMVEFANGIIAVDAGMFKNSTMLATLSIPLTVTDVGDEFISGCLGLRTLTVPAGLDMAITGGNITTLRTLNFIGTGATAPYTSETAKLTPWYRSTITMLNIAEGITEIGEYSYLRVSGAIVLPSTMEVVGAYAFYGSNTSDITFNSELVDIGAYAFYGTTMQNLVLPANLESLGDKAFADNKSLQTVVLPDSLSTVAGKPFFGCTNLSDVTVPITLDYSAGVFEGCSKILAYVFTSGTDGVGADYTSETYRLTPWFLAVSSSYSITVSFMEGVEEIGDYMFYGCVKSTYGIEGVGVAPQQKFVIFPDSLVSVGDYAFYGCTNVAGFTFGTGIETIGDYAFYGCKATTFKTLDLGDNIRAIGDYAFAGCISVTSATLGPDFESLGEGSFQNCSALASLVIPLRVNAVADDEHPAFEGCGNLTSITFNGSGDGFDYTDAAGQDSFYQKTPWYLNNAKSISLTFDPSSEIVSIGDNSFRGSSAIAGSLSLPDSVTVIGNHSFQGCNRITSVTLGDSITTIGDYAFEGCSLLGGELNISMHLDSIGAHAFENDSKITGLVGDLSGISTVGAYAFNGCSLLAGDAEKRVTLLNVVTVGDHAFYGTVVGSFEFGNKLANLGDLALFDQELASITVSATNSKYNTKDGILYLGTTTVIQYPAKMVKTDGYAVPESVTEILHYAFYGAEISGTLTIPDKSTPIILGEHAFSDSHITALSVPVNVATADVFDGCSSIASYTFVGKTSSGFLPADYYSVNHGHLPWSYAVPSVRATVEFISGVTAIDAYMFDGFTNMVSLSIPVSVSILGKDCFKGCNGLESLTAPISLNFAVDAGAGLTELSTIDFIGTGDGYDYSDAETGRKVLWYHSTVSSISFASGIESIGNYSYLRVSGAVVLPNTVNSVGDYAFYNGHEISSSDSITFSTNLETIGAYAFYGFAITSLELPSKVRSIGDCAFSNCALLRELVLPDSLVSYGGSPFRNCATLMTASLPISLDYSEGMFAGCTSLRNYHFTVGNGSAVDYTGKNIDTPWYVIVQASNNLNLTFATGIKTIGAHMFDGCNLVSALTYGIVGEGPNGELILPSTVETVGAYAFNGCTKISGVSLGTGVKNIGAHAFAGCTGIPSLVLGTSATNVGAGAFHGCTSLRTLTIPLSADTVVDNEDPVFAGCTKLEKFIFIGTGAGAAYSESDETGHCYIHAPWSISTASSITIEFDDACTVTSVGANTFRDVDLLTGDVVLPATVRSIGDRAFYGTSVTNFTFGSELVAIGDLALFDQELESISLNGNSRFKLFYGALYTADMQTLIVVPAKMAADSLVLSDRLVTVLHYAAYGSVMTGTLVIPATVTSIGDYAFAECTSLEALVVNSSAATLLGERCFHNDVSISEVRIPYSVRMAGLFSFDNNVALYTFTGGLSSSILSPYYRDNYQQMPWNFATVPVDIVFESGIGMVDDYMFYHDTPDYHIQSVTLPEGLTTIGTGSLFNCAGLKEIVFPNTLNTIGAKALDGCGNVESLAAPINLDLGIDTGSIRMTKLRFLTFTPGIGETHGIGIDYDNSFDKTLWYGSSGYTVTFEEGITAIGNNTYFRVAAVNFPSTLVRIGDSAFEGSTFTTITFNNGLQVIGDNAFKGCTGLSGLVLPASLVQLEGSSFSGCTGINTVTLPVTVDYSGGAFDGCLIYYYNFIAGTANGGKAFDYTVDNVKDTPWFAVCKSAVNPQNPVVKFASDITDIGDCMFAGCAVRNGSVYGISGILDLPADLNRIGDNAFSGCTLLTSVNFKEKLRTIGDNAFSGCVGLTKLQLNEGLISLGAGAFAGCNKVASLSLPITVNAVASNANPAFKDCNSIKEFIFLGSGAGFDYAEDESSDSFYKLTPWYTNRSDNFTLTLNSGITGIGDYMFAGCRGINGDLVFSNLTSLGAHAFEDADRITGIEATRVTEIGESAFYGCDLLTSADLSMLSEVSAYAFCGCSMLKEAVLSSCTSVGEAAFMNSGISTINGEEGTISLPDVVSIGAHAFENSGAVSVTVGTAGVDMVALGDYVFDKCAAIHDVTLLGNIPTLPEHLFKSSAVDSTLQVFNAAGARTVLTDLSGFTSLVSVDYSGATSFVGAESSATFENCTSLTTVCLNTAAGASFILADSMFKGCSNLNTIDLGRATFSGNSTFEGCTSLESVSMSVATFVPEGTFDGCTSLRTFNASNVTSIGKNAFRNSGITTYNSADAGMVSLTGVVTVGDNAFEGCTGFTGISGAGSVTTIGKEAFKDCSALDGEIVLSAVETVGDRAFYNATMTSVKFGEKLAVLGDLALFSPNLALIDVSASNTVFATSEGALYNKEKTELISIPAKLAVSDFDLPAGLVTIDHYAAYHASISGKLTIPSGVRNIGEFAFDGCANIDNLDIECINATVGEKAFNGMTRLTKITAPTNVRLGGLFAYDNLISEYVFIGNTQSGLPSGYYKDNFATMPWAFATKPVTVTFSEGIGEVDRYMFYFKEPNTSIIAINLPASMGTIKEYAFYNCAGLSSLTLPESVSTLEANCLSGCSNIENLTVPITLPLDIDDGSIGIIGLKNLRFTRGTDGIGYNYDESSSKQTLWYNSSNYVLSFESTIVSIGDYMYLKPSNIVTLPSSLQIIGKSAFEGAEVSTITFNSGLVTIDDRAFANTQLSNIVLPDSLEHLRGKPFLGCTHLTTVSMPIDVTYTKDMFEGCTIYNFAFTKGIEGKGATYDSTTSHNTPWYSTLSTRDISISFGNGVKSLGDYMFYDCIVTSGTVSYGISGSIKFPDSLESIGAYAFQNCRKVTNVVFDDALRSIGAYAFQNCIGLDSISLGTSVEEVGAYTFAGCTKVESLTIPLSFNVVANDQYPAFNGCSGIKTLNFIGNNPGYDYFNDQSHNAYYQKTPWYFSQGNLITVTFADTIPSIGNYTFYGCKGLSGTVALPESVKSVGIWAFRGCTGITSLSMDYDSIGLGNGCFANCSGITTVTMPISANAVGFVPDNKDVFAVFQGTNNVSHFTFTGYAGYNYSTDTKSDSFYQLTPWYLNRVTSIRVSFEDTVSSIGANMFYGCVMLDNSVVLPTNLVTINDNAFRNCINLDSVEAPGVTGIGTHVFDGASTMADAQFPQLSRVQEYTFYNCTGLTSATLTNCTVIDTYAFANSGIRNINSDTGNTVVLPRVTSLGNYAFANSGIVNVSIGTEAVAMTIGNGVFLECKNLKEIILNGKISMLPVDTFRAVATANSFVSPLRKIVAKDVTNFAASLKDNFSNLEEVDISGSTVFGSGNDSVGLFQNCTSLTKVALFVNKTSATRVALPAYMFAGCTALENIDLNNVALQNGHEFEGCSKLPAVSLANSTNISEYAFNGCSSLSYVSAPKVVVIGAYAFNGCGLTEINTTQMASVTTLGDYAFSNCEYLESVTLPKVDSCGIGAFSECGSLETVELNKLSEVPEKMFYNDVSLVEVSLPDAISLGATSFFNCSKLEELELPNVANIGIINESATFDDYREYSVFYKCTSLTSVSMPMVKVIGTLAFYQCSALSAFNNDSSIMLTGVTTISKGAFAETGVGIVTVGAQAGGITEIGDYAFYKCPDLQSFTSPSLTKLPEHLFNNSDITKTITDAPMLTSIVVPAVTSFMANLHDSAKLTRVEMESATEFGDGIFTRCTGLTTVKLMKNESAGAIVQLSALMFQGCNRLATINFDNVDLKGSLSNYTDGSTFLGCVALVSVELPVATQIPAGTFNGCNHLTSVNAPKVENIGVEAFQGCSILSDVQVPNASVIGDKAFSGCTTLANFNSKSLYNPLLNITSIGSEAFKGCGFTQVVLGPGLTTLGAGAFANNTKLTTVVTNDGLTRIGEGAFQGCPITEAHISSSVNRIDAHAFDFQNTIVATTDFYFNADINSIMKINGAITGRSSTVFNMHVMGNNAIPAESWKGTVITGLNVIIKSEYVATVIIQFDGTTIAPVSVTAIYGGRIVLPYYNLNGTIRCFYFAMSSSAGPFAMFVDDEHFDKDEVAISGDAVPIYPLLSGRDTLTVTGYADCDEFIREVTIESKTYNEDALYPLSTDVHYGSLFEIPHFVNPLVQVTALQMMRADGSPYGLELGTTKIFIGYNFSEVWLSSKETKVTVYFVNGDDIEPTEVVIQSLFEVPKELEYMEVPAPGYTFAGWWSNPGQGGERAIVGQTKFLGGQTWYARFEPVKYTVTVASDEPYYTVEIEVVGPYNFHVVDGDLYYTDLEHAQNTLACSKAAVEGYTVNLFMDLSNNRVITGDTDALVGNRTVFLSLQMNYYSISLMFTYQGQTIEDQSFLIENWDVGTETLYKSGDKIENIPFTKIRAGLLLPAPMNQVYALSYVYANNERIDHTSDGYFLTPSSFKGTTSAVISYAMETGQFSVNYHINDDADTIVNTGDTYKEGNIITMVSVRGYSKVGYTFVGFQIEGLETIYKSMDQVMLTRQIMETAEYCTITINGIWKPIEYTVFFDLAGAPQDVPVPEALTGLKIGDVLVLPKVKDYPGHTITGWHWILGDNVSSVTHSTDFVLDKAMIEGYATSDLKITLQCEWGSKNYAVSVDNQSGIKFVSKTVKYGDSFQLWNIGNYTRAFMKFGGWSVGIDGTVYENYTTVTFDDEMAIYADSHNGEVMFYLVWIANEYQVQYNLDGGDGSIPIDNNVYKVSDPDTPFALKAWDGTFYKDGYTFAGWRYSSTSAIVYNNTTGLFDPVLAQSADSNGVVTFYAVWSQKSYKITYVLGGGVSGSYAPVNILYGEDVIISAPTRAGYDFIGWKAATSATESGHLTSGALCYSSGSYRSWDGTRTVNVNTFRDLCSVDGGTVVFTAVWDNATYSVSYNKNGGTGTIIDEMNTIKLGDIIRLPSFREASKTGYSFIGWGIDTVNVIPENTEFTADMVEGGVNTVVFYAVWQPNTYDVKYRYINSQSYIDLDATYNSPINLPSYDRTGYTFAGWQITGADTNAYWSNDGVAWYKLGSTVVKGTYFKNLTSNNGGTVTIDAIWNPVKYRINYSANGGTGKAPIDSEVYVIDDSVKLKDFHVLDGTNGNKSVIGWSLEANGSVTSFDTFTEGLASRADVAGNVTLYAVWVEGMCTITIDLTGLQVSSIPSGWSMVTEGIYSTSVPYGTSMKDVMSDWEKVTVSKDGYTFTDWGYGGGTVTGNIEVKPEFEEVNMNILYIFGGIVGAVVVGIIAVSRLRR